MPKRKTARRAVTAASGGHVKTIRIDDQEKRATESAAAGRGVSWTNYIRTLIRKEHGLGDFGSNTAPG